MDRKQFLIFIAGQIFLLPALFANNKKSKNLNSIKKIPQILVGAYFETLPKIDKNNRTAEDSQSSIQIYDLETSKIQSIKADFFAHSFAQNPLNKNMIAASSKWAHRAGVFDIKKKKQTLNLVAPKGERFFGHVQFDNQGTLYISAAKGDDEQEGCIHSYNPNNGKLLKTFETGGRAPHDFYFIKEDVICVANASEHIKNKSVGILSLIDVSTNKITQNYKIVEPNHLLSLSDDSVLISSLITGTEVGEFYKYSFSEKKITDSKTSKNYQSYFHNGEKLSLAVITKDLAAVTTANGQKILFWNHKENKMITKSFSNPMFGLVAINNEIFVTNNEGTLTNFLIDEYGNTVRGEKTLAENFSNTAHMKLMSI